MQLLQGLAIQIRVILDLPLEAVTRAGDIDLISLPVDLNTGLSDAPMIRRPLGERREAVNRDRQTHLTFWYPLPADLLCCGDPYSCLLLRHLALLLL